MIRKVYTLQKVIPFLEGKNAEKSPLDLVVVYCILYNQEGENSSMFHHAVESIRYNVIPIIIVTLTKQGELKSGIGTGIIINKDGWLITAGHVLKNIHKARQEKAHGIIKDYVVFYGHTRADTEKIFMHRTGLDLGYIKLKNFYPPQIYDYPKFRAGPILQGELFCRIGYPFLKFSCNYNNGEFSITNYANIPFINEALVSRFTNYRLFTMIETSTPGAPGQSGGPLVDPDGIICGIHIGTKPYDLHPANGTKQFLHVGQAIHVKTIDYYLNLNNIDHQLEQ